MKLKIKLTNLPELTVTHLTKEIADGVWFVEGVLDDEWEFRATVRNHYIIFSDEGIRGICFVMAYQGEGMSYGGKDFGMLDVFFPEQDYYPVEIKGGDGVFSFIILSKKVRDAMTDVRDAYWETYLPCEVIQ